MQEKLTSPAASLSPQWGVGRMEGWGDDHGVVQRPVEKAGRRGGGEVVVGVPQRPVHHDQGAAHAWVGPVEGSGRIGHGALAGLQLEPRISLCNAAVAVTQVAARAATGREKGYQGARIRARMRPG